MFELPAAALSPLLTLVRLADDVPEDSEVKGGFIGLAFFVGMIVAVGLLCWSFFRQMKKANAAQKAGVYGDEPSDAEAADSKDV